MKVLPFFLAMALLALSACSTTPEYKGIYKGGPILQPLQVPPDLSEPIDSDASDAVTSYLSYQKNLHAENKNQVLQPFPRMQFVRRGCGFWLDIDDSPTDVWNSLIRFFTRLGFKIISKQPSLGLMQTNYIQNRANIPSNWFMKLVDSFSISGLMDSYHAQIEYDAAKKMTRVFITQLGLRQVSDSDHAKIKVGDTYWVVRPTDPELEQEMLMRFMEFRGMGEKQAKQIIAEAKPVVKAVLKQTPQGYVLQYNDTFARVWRLAGIALDRMGVQIDDRDRSAGVYYLQLPDSFQLNNQTGFLASGKKPSGNKYLLTLEDKGDYTLLMIKAHGAVGKDLNQVSKQLLEELKNDL